MRSLLRMLLLLVLLVAYGVQAAASQQHVHELGERKDCAACAFHATPGTPPPAPLALIPERPAPYAEPTLPPVAPPPALEPGDVSFATSPPAV